MYSNIFFLATFLIGSSSNLVEVSWEMHPPKAKIGSTSHNGDRAASNNEESILYVTKWRQLRLQMNRCTYYWDG